MSMKAWELSSLRALFALEAAGLLDGREKKEDVRRIMILPTPQTETSTRVKGEREELEMDILDEMLNENRNYWYN